MQTELSGALFLDIARTLFKNVHALSSFHFRFTNVQSATKLCDQTKDFHFLWQQGKKVCATKTTKNLHIFESKVSHDTLLHKVHCCSIPF
jgi:hypothetical protein